MKMNPDIRMKPLDEDGSRLIQRLIDEAFVDWALRPLDEGIWEQREPSKQQPASRRSLRRVDGAS